MEGGAQRWATGLENQATGNGKGSTPSPSANLDGKSAVELKRFAKPIVSKGIWFDSSAIRHFNYGFAEARWRNFGHVSCEGILLPERAPLKRPGRV